MLTKFRKLDVGDEFYIKDEPSEILRKVGISLAIDETDTWVDVDPGDMVFKMENHAEEYHTLEE